MSIVMENKADGQGGGWIRTFRTVQDCKFDELRYLFLRTRLAGIVIQKWGVKIMSKHIFFRIGGIAQALL